MPPPKDVVPPSLCGIRVLVVEDDTDTLEMVTEMLSGVQAEVCATTSVAEAVSMLRSRPHVIVSDLGMPTCDGLQFMRIVRSHPAELGGSTPAIALTGRVGDVDHTRALLAGFQVHLGKPVDRDALIAAIARLVEGGSANAR